MIAITTAHLADISIVVNCALFVFIVARTPHATKLHRQARQRLDQRQADPYDPGIRASLQRYPTHAAWADVMLLPRPPAGVNPSTWYAKDVGEVDVATVEQMFERGKRN